MFDEKHFRYYNVPGGKILLTENFWMKTEAQLCTWMFRKWGEGRYYVRAWQVGYQGFWRFWLGNLYKNGFERDRGINREVEKLKKEWKKPNMTYEDKEEIEEEIQFEKEIYKLDKSSKRVGLRMLQKLKPGVLHPYVDI